MMKASKVILGMAAMSMLGSCAMMMAKPTTYTFKHNAVAADPSAMGTAAVMADSAGMSKTTLTLSGLTPGKAYIAHYHAFGPDSSTNPCASNGPVSVGFPNFTADAAGSATVMLSADMTKIAGDMGAYINVHYASDPSVVPVCAAIKMTKG
ncbi:CHRD domain-containing protein [Deinococcus detaillensis]|uniref:CHRD domain-containing protein n=1 Tax=Deinococcus detaillensis TaxID=2592048 RepID=A0A553UUM1_9DEIO|nr:CHRD domain-containing protein [Deinococcus detaillensis]TSA83865.1 CHRD domain-containing protein [Deinococcus detaillensis]